MTPPDERLSPERLAEIAGRHNELCIMYGGEPWDDSCVEDGEQAHQDRAALLSHIRSLALVANGAGVDTQIVCGACGQIWVDGLECGQKDNGHPFPTCYPANVIIHSPAPFFGAAGAAPDEVGFGWKLSEEAARDIAEIDQNTYMPKFP